MNKKRVLRIYVTITYVIGTSLCSDVQNTNKPSSSRTSRDLDMTSWKATLRFSNKLCSTEFPQGRSAKLSLNKFRNVYVEVFVEWAEVPDKGLPLNRLLPCRG